MVEDVALHVLVNRPGGVRGIGVDFERQAGLGRRELADDEEHALRHVAAVLQIGSRIGAEVADVGDAARVPRVRSEEHTSELQSLMRTSYAVVWLIEKKKP